MARTGHIEFTADIAAPVATVFRLMLDPQGYREGTSSFAEGSHFMGSWQQARETCFLSPSGDGMVSEITAHWPYEFSFIRHLVNVAQRVQDTQSDGVRAWALADENDRFLPTPRGTRLVIERDAMPEFKACHAEARPKALCETAAR